jgi:spore maturation protein CgeB
LARRGHDVLFLEHDKPWYASNRDLPNPPYGRTQLYDDLNDLATRFGDDVRRADAVVVGSYVPDGVAVGEWVTTVAGGVTAFYDIDTPVTLAKLAQDQFEYLAPRLIARYDLYLSFTGGPTLKRLEREFGSPCARALYCSADPELYFPDLESRVSDFKWDLGYLGTYSPDRQPTLERLLIEAARRWPAGRFVVAGPQYPASIDWPANVERIEHLPPDQHRAFYNGQRFTLNVTRQDMIRAGHSPSVRLFEAAACGTPIVSDRWSGIETLFEPGEEIILADGADDVLTLLRDCDECCRREVARAARRRVLDSHTAAHRAAEFERYVNEVRTRKCASRGHG